MNEIMHPGLVIETEDAELRNEAKAAHRLWLAQPTTAHKADYAAKLARYGHYSKNANMIGHAERLQTECQHG